EHAVEVGVDDAFPVLDGEVLEQAAGADTCVVEQKVDSAPGRHSLLEELLHRGGVGNVGGDRENAVRAAVTAGEGLQGFCAAARGSHAPTGAQQGFGGGKSDAA